MPSIHAYSREDCAGCGVKDALLKYGTCIHCGTPYDYVPVRADHDAMGYESRLRGVAKTAVARRKLRYGGSHG